MEQPEIQLLAKYPFMRTARDYVSSLRLSTEELFRHPVYSSAIGFGKERVVDCMESRYSPAGRDPALVILSYPVARMIALSVGPSVASRYAEGEAEAAHNLMRKEDEAVLRLLRLDLGVKTTDGKMPLTQYLRLAAHLAKKASEWKLSNRAVDRGMVRVEEPDEAMLLKEAVRQRVLEPVDLKKVPSEIKKATAELKTALIGDRTEVRIEKLEDGAVPPCMRSIMAALALGDASHNAMFILATFLANLGLKDQDILSIYSRSPKYDEGKTLYQMGFIRGTRGGREYTCPTCDTIKAHGLCKAQCSVKHPLQYYRRNATGRTVPKSPS